MIPGDDDVARSAGNDASLVAVDGLGPMEVVPRAWIDDTLARVPTSDEELNAGLALLRMLDGALAEAETRQVRKAIQLGLSVDQIALLTHQPVERMRAMAFGVHGSDVDTHFY